MYLQQQRKTTMNTTTIKPTTIKPTHYIVEITYQECHRYMGAKARYEISVKHYGDYTPFEDLEHAIDDERFETGDDCYHYSQMSWVAWDANGEKVEYKCVNGKQRFVSYEQFINAYLVLCENFNENYDLIMKMREDYPEFVPAQ